MRADAAMLRFWRAGSDSYPCLSRQGIGLAQRTYWIRGEGRGVKTGSEKNHFEEGQPSEVSGRAAIQKPWRDWRI